MVNPKKMSLRGGVGIQQRHHHAKTQRSKQTVSGRIKEEHETPGGPEAGETQLPRGKAPTGGIPEGKVH